MVPNRVTHHIWILIGRPLLKPWNSKLAALNISTVTIKGLQGDSFSINFLTFQTSYSSEPQLPFYLDGFIKKTLL